MKGNLLNISRKRAGFITGVSLVLAAGFCSFTVFHIYELENMLSSLSVHIISMADRDFLLKGDLKELQDLTLLIKNANTQNKKLLAEIIENLDSKEPGEKVVSPGLIPEFRDLGGLSPFEPWDQQEFRVSGLNNLTLSPYHVETLMGLGHSFYNGGNLEQSLYYFTKVTEVDPLNRDACLIAAKSAFGLDKYEESLIFINRLLEQGEEADLFVFQGECLFCLGEFSSARNSIDRALGVDENHLDALEWGGRISLALVDYFSAESYYSRAVAIDPQREYFLALGDLSRFTGKDAQAYDFWERGASLNPLETRGDQEQQLVLYEKMALCAYDLEDDSRLEYCFYHSEKLGGTEKIHILLVRREKQKGRAREALRRINELRIRYPSNGYEDELRLILSWAKGA